MGGFGKGNQNLAMQATSHYERCQCLLRELLLHACADCDCVLELVEDDNKLYFMVFDWAGNQNSGDYLLCVLRAGMQPPTIIVL